MSGKSKWVIDNKLGEGGGDWLSRGRMKNDAVSNDESAVTCMQGITVLTKYQLHLYIQISFYGDSHHPEMEALLI